MSLIYVHFDDGSYMPFDDDEGDAVLYSRQRFPDREIIGVFSAPPDEKEPDEAQIFMFDNP